MNKTLARLQDMAPATLWTIAPKPLLMQGAGLMATGEIIDWNWTSESTLEVEFRNRLSVLVHRLRWENGALTGECSSHGRSQPCPHHLATLMLCMHLMKDFGAFGRLPNRVLAEQLKIKLLQPVANPGMAAPSASTMLMSRQARQDQRHVLLRADGSGRLITYRDSHDERVQDAFATLPNELAGFVSMWSFEDREAEFWRWFTSAKRSFPVFVRTGSQALQVSPLTETSRYSAALELHLDEQSLRLRRQLLYDGLPLSVPVKPVGRSLVLLQQDPPVLMRLREDSAWHAWPALLAEVFMGDDFAGAVAIPSGQEIALDLGDWNAMSGDWEDLHGTRPGWMPALFWQGEPVDKPSVLDAEANIELQPIQTRPDMMAVVPRVGRGEIHTSMMHAWLNPEVEIEAHAGDSGLCNAKNRRSVILEALYSAALAEEDKDRRMIYRTLEEHEIFRNSTQAKAAVRGVKRFMGEEIDKAGPPLLASHRLGWVRLRFSTALVRTTAALVRQVLGAVHAAELNVALDSPDGSTLVVPHLEALPRLPALMEAATKHGITLSYTRQPVQMTGLDCHVSAAAGSAIDFFELKPEVRCAGDLIPQDQWEQLMTRGHLIDPATGALRVIDAASLESLRRLHSTFTRQRGERRERKEDDLKELLQIPRVRILDWLLLKKHGISCDLPEAEQRILESLLNFEALDRTPLPASLLAKLRDYQHAGYSWLAFLYRHGFGGCLADDMGLGKTLQTIALFAAIKEGIVKPLSADPQDRRAHLLVVPPTLLFNWTNEVKTFCPGLYVHEYTGKGRSLIGIREGIVLTTYDIVRRDIESLRNEKFDCIVFDEAQAVKNLLGERSKAMRQLEGRAKFVLTGTPLENHAGEYYSIIDLALPGLFGDYKDFNEAVRNPGGTFNPLDRARPFVLRRTKEKILKELPPKVESDMQLDLTEEQKRFYTRAVADVRQQVFEAFADKTAQQAGIVALAALTRLRQICVSPAMIDTTHSEVSPKLGYLTGKLEELIAEGHAALVFSQFTKALDLLEPQLAAAGLDFQRLDGSTPQQKRKTLVEAYQTGKGPGIFLISLKAGGAGLNLTRASYVFHLDPWWNPAAENQASDRAHRMGQKQTVFIQRLLMRHTIEEKIMTLKAQKKELFERVLANAEDKPTTQAPLITREDFKFLLE